ncbi:MAG: TonB-dependent siderophore receptor [Nitrospirales bacterium]
MWNHGEAIAKVAGGKQTVSTINFDIPAQGLDSALHAFGKQSQQSLLYSSELGQGRTSQRLVGRYSTQQALQILLKDSGLTHHITPAGTVTIKENKTVPHRLLTAMDTEPASRETSTGNQTPPSSSDNIQTLPEVHVPGLRLIKPSIIGYSTKTTIPLLQTPHSIQSVPEIVLKDQRINRLQEVLENVSGIRSFSNDFEGYIFNIRGFQSKNLYRNSLLSSLAVATAYDTASYDRIEIVKGPASILYGQIAPGGLINLIPKRPLDKLYLNVEQEFGSFEHFRTVWDATGPVDENKTLLLRFSGAYQNSDSFRDFHEQERFVFHPSLTWRPTDSTQLSFEFEYFKHNVQNELGIPAIGNRPASVPLSRSFQEPDDPLDETHKTTVGVEFHHAFNESWSVNNKFHYIDSFMEKIDAAPFELLADNRTLRREIIGQQLDTDGIYNNNINLAGTFDVLDTNHQTLVGYDYYYELYNYFATGSFEGTITEISSIDVFSPVYAGLSSAQILALFNAQPRAFFPQKIEQHGIYFQDHITLFDVLHIRGGGRYDWASISTSFSATSAADARSNFTKVKDKEFSPHVGILYQPLPWLSLYGSWSNSFQNNSGAVDANNNPLDPQDGEQWEAGIKAELLERKLSATLSYFHLALENVAVLDETTTGNDSDSIAAPKQTSHGIELDILGQITDEVGIIASYAYLDTDAGSNATLGFGSELPNAPTHSGSAFLTYEFRQYEPLNGLRVGVGAYAVGSRQGDNANSFTLPGYVRMDAFASYTKMVSTSRVTASINIRNLLDHEYFEGTDQFFGQGARLAIWPGAPLTAIGMLRIEYGS